MATTKRSPQRPSTKTRRKRAGKRRRGSSPSPRGLRYKVVELSTVDEGTLERAVNEWVAFGWRLEGVQFAMRESSKRPSMAFVFFTREDALLTGELEAPALEPMAEGAAEVRAMSEVVREELNPVTTSVRDAWARLTALSNEGEDVP